MSIEDVAWEPPYLAPIPDAALEAVVRRENGGPLPPGTLQVTPAPWLARAPGLLNWFNGRLAHLDVRTAEKLALVVSQDNSCRYCFAAHRVLMRFIGFDDTTIRRLEHDLLVSEQPAAEQSALAFARRLSRGTPPVSGAELAPLRDAGWGDDAIREMALVCGAMIAFNRSSTFLALDPEPYEALPDRWHMRILRPLIGLVLRLRTRPGAPVSFSAAERAAPFARVLNGFDGLPLGRSLRLVLDEAWAFDGLSKRAKALVTAVVAHALGDAALVADARALACAHGSTDAEVDEVLAHLRAPTLDAPTCAAVAFARESVFYEPAPIQRRCRALVEELTLPVMLDLVGVASLANTLARLGAFAEPARAG